jgi:hypothetical protein
LRLAMQAESFGLQAFWRSHLNKLDDVIRPKITRLLDAVDYPDPDKSSLEIIRSG